MRKPSTYQRTLQEILDSDDELTPNDFVESTFIPAYKDDSRFKYFKELMEKGKHSSKSKHKIDAPSTQDETLKSGVFSEKDVLCLQCLNGVQSDTFLWLFEFLIHKDIQSNYNFLKSCLVPKYENYYSKNFSVINGGMFCSNRIKKGTQYKYEIVLNKCSS